MDKSVSLSAHEGERVQIHKKFRFYNITWHIEKFSVQSCSEKWKTSTPELDGPQKIKLNLILKRIEGKSRSKFNLSFIVKRSDSDAGPQTVWINFSMHISGKYINPRYIVSNRLCCLNKGTEIESNIADTENLFNKIDAPESFKIYCKMIIYVEDKYAEFEKCGDVSLRLLSNDMLAVYERNRGHDIELKFGSFVIPAHKSILYARCKVMKRMIDREIKKQKSLNFKTLDLSDCMRKTFETGAMEDVLTFFYTGNLNPLLHNPSLSVYDLALTFDIQEINEYYIEDCLGFLSSLDTCEFVIVWRIHGFGSVCENNKHILAPIFEEDNSSRTWQFRLCFQDHENVEYAAIFAETNETISMNLCLEISVLDADGRSSAVKVLRKHIDSCSMFGFEEFAQKNWIKSAAVRDTLTLSVSVKLSAGRQISAVEQHFLSTVSHAGSRSYENLSKDMRSLYEIDRFYDIVLRIGDDVRFFIHKSIVEVRCRFLYYMLINMEDGRGSFVIENMDPDVLQVILIYIYSGVVAVEEENNLLKVLKTANEFNLPILAMACKKLLLQLLNKEDNWLRVSSYSRLAS